jgi:hypothetical protein
MKQAITHYKKIGKPIEWRTLQYRPGGSALLAKIRSGK